MLDKKILFRANQRTLDWFVDNMNYSDFEPDDIKIEYVEVVTKQMIIDKFYKEFIGVVDV